MPFVDGLRARQPEVTTSSVAFSRAYAVFRLVALGVIMGMYAVSTLKFQTLMPKVASGMGVPFWLVAVGGLAALSGAAVGTGVIRQLMARYPLRVLAAATGATTATALFGMSRSPSLPAFIAWCLVVGLVNQGGVVIYAHVLGAREPGNQTGYLIAQGGFMIGFCTGIFGGKLLDSQFARETWTGGVLAQAAGVAVVCGAAYVLVGRDLQGRTGLPRRPQGPCFVFVMALAALVFGGHAVAALCGLDRWGGGLALPLLIVLVLAVVFRKSLKRPEKPVRLDPDMRRIGAVRMWSQATLMLFDSSLTLLLDLRNLGIDRVAGLTSTLIVGSVLAAFATLAVRRSPRMMLIITAAIVFVWPAVGVGFATPGPSFMWILWMSALVLEGTTSTHSGALALLRPDVPEWAQAAFLARRAALGQLIGVALEVVLLLFADRVDGHGIALQWPLIVVGSLLGMIVLFFLRAVWRERDPLARPSAAGVLVGSGTGLGYVCASMTALFVPQIARTFGLREGEVLLLVIVGWAAMAGCLKYARGLRGRNPRTATRVAAALAGLGGAELIAWAPGPWIVGLGLLLLGVTAAMTQVVQSGERGRTVRMKGDIVALNSTIALFITLVNTVVLSAGAIIGGIGDSGWRWAHHALAGLLLVLSVAWLFHRLPTTTPRRGRRRARKAALKRIDRRPRTRYTKLTALGISGAYTALYVPLPSLLADRGGFGVLTGAVVAGLTAARIIAGPVPSLAKPLIRRSLPATSRWCYRAGAMTAIAMAVVALLVEGTPLAICYGVGIVLVEAGIGLGYVASKSRWDTDPDRGVIAMIVPQWRALAGVALNLIAGAAIAGTSLLGDVVPGAVMGITLGDVGRALVLVAGAGFALLAARFGPRVPLVDALPQLAGDGGLAIAVVPPQDERPAALLFSSQGSAELVELDPGEEAVGRWRQDGLDFFHVGVLDLPEPLGPRGLPATIWISDDRRSHLLDAGGYGHFAIRWQGEDPAEMTRVYATPEPHELEALRSSRPEVDPGDRLEFVMLEGPDLRGFDVVSRKQRRSAALPRQPWTASPTWGLRGGITPNR